MGNISARTQSELVITRNSHSKKDILCRASRRLNTGTLLITALHVLKRLSCVNIAIIYSFIYLFNCSFYDSNATETNSK